MLKTIKRSDRDYEKKSKSRLVKTSDLKSMRKERENVAGIDVGAGSHFVAAPDPRCPGKLVVKEFGSFTENLRECVEWLIKCNITSVAMEATGVYWTILFSMLEEANIEVVLVNAYDFSKMKPKKTDVKDAEFLQLYHSHGLLSGAFIPERKVKELRTIVRSRAMLVEDSATEIQRMQKALVCMNLRLDNVLADISGVTGMRIIEAIIRGERDPKKLATFRDGRCKKSEAEIEASLNGFYQGDQLFVLKMAYEKYQFFMTKLLEYDQQLKLQLAAFETVPLKEKSIDPEKQPRKKSVSRKQKPFEFSFDVEREITRITGLSITRLAGVGASTALTLISETGLDMKKWATAKHFASWVRVAPNIRVSGGKILSRKTKQGNTIVGVAFRRSTASLYRDKNDTALGMFVKRKRAQLGAPIAITAGANKLCKMYYNLLSTGKPFVEPGAQAYLEMNKARVIDGARRRVRPLGYDVVETEPHKSQKTA